MTYPHSQRKSTGAKRSAERTNWTPPVNQGQRGTSCVTSQRKLTKLPQPWQTSSPRVIGSLSSGSTRGANIANNISNSGKVYFTHLHMPSPILLNYAQTRLANCFD